MSEDRTDQTRALRDALGMFATGVAVVTTRSPQGAPIGLTINSFNSVSLDPPLIVWSLAREQADLSIYEACEYYAVNILAADQVELSQRFASRLEDRFAGVEHDLGIGGIPLLRDGCARFECRNTLRHDGGDHLMFVSEVVAFECTPRLPLVFFGGMYRALEEI